MSELFGATFYVNLAHRTDRRQEIESELNRMDISFERFPAIQWNPGYIGCSASHLEILKEAKRRALPNVLILEDDFEFLVSREEFWSIMTVAMSQSYDVIMIGYNVNKATPHNNILQKVLFGGTTSGYVVHAKMYDTLIRVWEEALPLLKGTHEPWNYALDVAWRPLQPSSEWYATLQRVGRQRASFSDIEGKHTDYGV
jgi:glycosyl transferase family 25